MTMAESNSLIRQHKRMAMGQDPDQDETFGVKPHSHTNKANSEPEVHRRPAMRDGRRGISKGRGFHPAPDHGPVE
jgi:hypothetical protein